MSLLATGALPAAYAVPGQRLTPGLLTIAPPGQHLILTAGDVLRLLRWRPVHNIRPAVDPLLHSAARVCGDRVVAVVLSGHLRNGADGVGAVAAAGGVVFVQDPVDARSPGMPRAVLGQVPQATMWPAAKLGPAIVDLVDPPAVGRSDEGIPPGPPRVPSKVERIDDAPWTAVSQLHAHAAAQRRFHQRLDDTSPLVAQCRSRAARALQAAEVITEHVMPSFQPGAPERTT